MKDPPQDGDASLKWGEWGEWSLVFKKDHIDKGKEGRQLFHCGLKQPDAETRAQR